MGRTSTLAQRIEDACHLGGAVTFVGSTAGGAVGQPGSGEVVGGPSGAGSSGEVVGGPSGAGSSTVASRSGAGAGPGVRVTWAELHEEARAVAAGLQALGVRPGDHVGVLGPTSRALVTAVQAIWLVGAAAVMVPLPLRLASLEEFASQTRRLLARADVRLTLVAPDLAGLVESSPDDPPLVPLDALGPFLGPDRSGTCGGSGGSGDRRRAGAFLHDGADRRAADFAPPPPDPGRTAIVQYTSGSTADPKGVVLPHAQVMANVDAIVAGIGLVAGEDTVVSWLPLYHDMGLIGMLAVPMAAGLDLVLAAPQDFMASPSRWLEWMSDFRGTCTAGPNFAYALATRAMARMEGLDLSSWRLALNGAEPIDPAAVEAFCAAGERHGLDPRAVFCAFGMAEAVLAVTFPDPGSGLSTDTVDRRALERERAAIPAAPGDPGARRLARLGQPVGDLEIRIVDPADPDPGNCAPRLRGEREVGELQVRGSSVTPGYYADPEATAAAFTADGWLRTGDLAYLAEGELVVCGRSKDVIIVGGRNVFPEDVERAVGGVPGVRAGNVIAFGVEGRNGREGVVVVAETREADPSPLRPAVAEAVRSSVGVPARDIVLVDPGSLPKTSSGKLQRSLCRQRYLGSELQPVPGGDRSGQDPGRHGDANPAQT